MSSDFIHIQPTFTFYGLFIILGYLVFCDLVVWLLNWAKGGWFDADL